MSAVLQQIGDAREADPFPPPEERPRYIVLDDWRRHQKRKIPPGVYYCGLADKGKEAPPEPFETWICSPLHVKAITRDGQGNNFGRLLRFKPTLGGWREWALPMEMLKGSGEEMRGELLSMGVEMDLKARQQLGFYLQGQHPEKTLLCATQLGWSGDSFVLPDRVIGPDADGVIFQSGERHHDEYTRGGHLEGWRAELAALAPGNPLLVLALSGAFAGPLLAKVHSEGGGVHLVGDSSTGKTTAIEAACSVWGGSNFKRSWRTTANGLEGVAVLFNDGLLALDEISEADPREVGAIVYSLGNGRGKQRASRTGAARSVHRWRCFILSSGERTLATTMHEGGKRAKAGQSVRMLDIPVTGHHGLYDVLHGHPSGAALSDAIKTAAAKHHGHAGVAFLEHLTEDRRNLAELLEQFKALKEFAVEGDGQIKRAAARFALIGLAGELANEYGVTGWPEGEALKAAARCFDLWRTGRPKGNDEARQIREALSGFLERHGDSRFSEVGDERIVVNRAGWWDNDSGDRRYLFTADGMREALTGFDFRRALDVLQEVGALEAPGADGKRARPFRIGGRVAKLYPIHPERLETGAYVD